MLFKPFHVGKLLYTAINFDEFISSKRGSSCKVGSTAKENFCV